MSIADDLAKKGPRPKVVILALHDEILEAIKLGYTKIAIWRLLTEQGKLDCSSELFTKYVNRYVLKKNSLSENSETPKREEGNPPKRRPIVPPPKEKKKTFQFDPMRGKDLI